MPRDYVLSKDVRELVSSPVFEKASRAKKLENRFLSNIDVFLCLSEKEAAALAFPNLGRLDYLGFRVENESVIEWANSLYVYYWEKATAQIPDQLVR